MPNSEKIKILIVDDNVQMRNLLRITFSNYPNCELFQAQNGAEALAIIHSEHPHIVFLDIMMPGEIDGLGVCECVKTSNFKDCFIVLLSAKGQKSDMEKGYSVGADMYLTKPFSPLALIEIVEKYKAQKINNLT